MSNSKITRRTFIGSLAAGGAATIGLGQGSNSNRIDRYALFFRHNPVLKKLEPLSPLSVGNGEFAFTCDITGLQTFPDAYKDAMPLCTMSQWGWHTKPMPEHLKGKELKLNEYETYGRKVGYMTLKTGQEELFDYLRENPHRLHLGQIGFDFGSDSSPNEISDIEQRLNLWEGIVHSRYRFRGEAVYVQTAVDDRLATVAVRVESALIEQGLLAIRVAFPYGSPSMGAADWDSDGRHRSVVLKEFRNGAVIQRDLDGYRYYSNLHWTSSRFEKLGDHKYRIRPNGTGAMDFTIHFGTMPSPYQASVNHTFFSARNYWRKFWSTGGVIDFSRSKDPRANELERRVVLWQYVTAINCSGSTPPQETGLTTNSWYGKFHLEMHWWHAAQFALWNRLPMLERSLDWYNKILPSARERARQQGYKGARWPKMTDPSGRDSPSPVGTLLIWQQPHPIFYSELAYLNKPTKATLEKYRSIVEETAIWMADYAHFDAATNRYVLGPPFIPAQENHPARETWNATYELEYWRYGLKTANAWRVKLGVEREPKWDDIIAKLSKLPEGDGVSRVSSPHVSKGSSTASSVCLAHENAPQTYTERNHDHPSMLAALGVLRGEMVDRETMRRTLKKVTEVWDWPSTWGWDYPMIAMTAARLGEAKTAIDALMIDTPKNRYSANGHNYQRPNLPLYLPGNGGLLYAIAMMANGWKGSPARKAPGFPADGSWTVRTEGFNASIFNEI